jgi:capsular polysaccharide biosynthesis protein
MPAHAGRCSLREHDRKRGRRGITDEGAPEFDRNTQWPLAINAAPTFGGSAPMAAVNADAAVSYQAVAISTEMVVAISR